MKTLFKKAQKLENGPMSYKNNHLIIPLKGLMFHDSLLHQGLYSFEFFKFHDFFHDLF